MVKVIKNKLNKKQRMHNQRIRKKSSKTAGKKRRCCPCGSSSSSSDSSTYSSPLIITNKPTPILLSPQTRKFLSDRASARQQCSRTKKKDSITSKLCKAITPRSSESKKNR